MKRRYDDKELKEVFKKINAKGTNIIQPMDTIFDIRKMINLEPIDYNWDKYQR
jgi:hypothetical protein